MDTEPSEKSQKSVSARRRLFQILAVGGTAAVVLPAKWVKPVVDAVIVPAHAAGSVVGRVSGTFGNSGTIQTMNSGNIMERFAGMIIGSAHATTSWSCGSLTNTVCISFSIPASPSTSVEVQVSSVGTNTTEIYPNNVIANVEVAGGVFRFTNLVATSLSVSGFVTSIGYPNCVPEAFSFPPSTVCFSNG